MMRAILTYHSVDDSGSPISIRPQAFRRHCERLAGAGPRVVAVEELLRLPADASAVAITFDDAYVNFAEHAWPVLEEQGLPVTLFVPTGHAGGSNGWDAHVASTPRLAVLDWGTLGRLADAGVSLGSHTRTHPHLPRLAPVQLADELARSAEELEQETGRRPAGLAYPYGAVDDQVAAAAATTYRYACTTELRPLNGKEPPHLLPRLDMYYLRAASGLERWGTLGFRLYLGGRAGARRWRQLLAAGAGT